jgi:ankyrin repeat protein
MPVTQNYIPARYDPRLKVEPCDPARVPYLPVEILYLIARALPQPKSVFNLALSSKETWEYLSPALFDCEVTFESRLSERYGGRSSDSLQQHFAKYLKGSFGDAETEEIITTSPEESEQTLQASGKGCQHGKPTEQCDECGERIRPDSRTFESPMPDDLLFTDRRLTALHWACIQGPSALPVALKAIRSALAHQPSYIDGVGLMERLYRDSTMNDGELIPADLPPPVFFAAAYGNVEVCKALIEAGCNVNLLQGQSVCQDRSLAHGWEPVMAFKAHKECGSSHGGMGLVWSVNRPLPCVCQWFSFNPRFEPLFEAPGCQTAGHVAIRYEKSEMLEILLGGGLDVQKGLVPLINYAVAQGNVAAVKVLLEHDPSLFHRRWRARPLIQGVPFIRSRPGDKGTQDGRVRGMIEYLVAKGENLDSRADAVEDDGYYDSGMTALQIALERAIEHDHYMPEVLDLLAAAELFIRMGASWTQPIPMGIDLEPFWDSVVQTVGILSDMYPLNESETARALENRKGWGRVVKAMIETASQSRSDADNSTANGVNLVDTFSGAFTRLVNFHELGGYRPQRFGPWGTEAVGRLLLSTGITPNDAEMGKWKTLCLNREEWTSEDGDQSHWAFLLDGIDANETEAE